MISLNSRNRALDVLTSLGLHPVVADIGEVEIPDNVSSKKFDLIRRALRRENFELLNNKETILAEKIKYVVVELIHYSEELPDINYSYYISDKLHRDYTYLARCFSKIKHTTISQFIIAQKIERVKLMLTFHNLTLSEIAWRLKYSSTSHLSTQFKKITGITPSAFKKTQLKKNN